VVLVLGGAELVVDVAGGAVVVVEDVVDGAAGAVGDGLVDAVERGAGSAGAESIAALVVQPRAEGARTGSMCMPSLMRHGLQAVGPSGQR